MNINVRPDEFVVLQQYHPTLVIDLKYCSHDNIVGRPIAGYAEDGVALLSATASQSLEKLIKALKTRALRDSLQLMEPTLLIWDAYRPQIAVDDFWAWTQNDCQKNKADYYPNCEKSQLFANGYFVRQSSHSRGSAIDLTIVDAFNGQSLPLNMGTGFDFMDELSHTDNVNVSPLAYRHRQWLKKLMNDFGWQGITKEWWHFTFQEEPFPDTYFNFPVINYQR